MLKTVVSKTVALLSAASQLCFFSFLFIIDINAQAGGLGRSLSFSETQAQLKHTNAQISLLQKTLIERQDKKKNLQTAYSSIEAEAQKVKEELNQLQKELQNKALCLKQLQEEGQKLEKRIEEAQKQMGATLRLRFHLSESRSLQGFLGDKNPQEKTYLLSLYRYLIQAQEQTLLELRDLKNKWKENQAAAKATILGQEQLKKTLAHQEEQLKQSKTEQQNLLNTLNQAIQEEKIRLDAYESYKKQLSLLLERLTQQSRHQPRQLFQRMQHRLPAPLEGRKEKFSQLQQGAFFPAEAGTMVYAVHPGKVVFSDWLNGYGYLMILDHGQGFMTLYAHNQALLKTVGQLVDQGDPIAKVGQSGWQRQNGLYFEIRQQGHPLAILSWLK